MDALRLILLVIGVVVVAAIYFYSRQARQERQRAQEMRELFEARSDALDDIPELDPSAAVRLEGHEAVPDEAFDRLSDLVAEPGTARHDDEASVAAATSMHAEARHPEGAAEPTSPARPVNRPADSSPAARPEPHKSGRHTDAVSDDAPKDELIIVCYIMAPAEAGAGFAGADIRTAAAEVGFEHGEMDIFHDHVGAAQSEPVLSLANALEPGTFDLSTMDDFSSPGLTLFLRLPGPLEGREAFERLLSKGRQLAERLDGELCDETRSVLTPQTVSHLRERVEAFRFKQQMSKLGKHRK